MFWNAADACSSMREMAAVLSASPPFAARTLNAGEQKAFRKPGGGKSSEAGTLGTWKKMPAADVFIKVCSGVFGIPPKSCKVNGARI